MAASTLATAAQYSPVSGLLPNARPGVVGVGPGNSIVKASQFSNPNAPAAGAAGAGAGTAPGATGTTPVDWNALINGDSGLKDAQAALAAGYASNQDQLNAQLANAYESFGKPVDLSTLASQLGMTQADIQKALGPDAQKLAQENTAAGLSTTARLDQANQKATQAILASLNKRGILNSGAAGAALGQQNLGYRQAEADAYQKFLGYLQQYYQGYVSAQQQRADQLASAYSSAADRQYNLHQYDTGAPAPAAPATQQSQGALPQAAPPDALSRYLTARGIRVNQAV